MIRTGLSVLLEERLDLLAGRQVGLVSHAAAVLPDLTNIVDAMLDAGVQLAALFGPQHGFSGVYGEDETGPLQADVADRRTGLPVHNLFGELQEPTPLMLSGLDGLVVDFQDVGARYYTFLSTLYYVMHAASAVDLPVFVLDRPNPISGLMVEGPLVEFGMESMPGAAPIPIRHGMTLGELALYMNTEFKLGASLTVIPMQGWLRSMWFDETGLPWVPPSPMMPHLSTATVYPGACLVEGTNLSEGRGTALPFEIAGAPWLDGYALAEQMNRRLLPGVRFRAHTFRPAEGKFSEVICEGVQIHVLDRLDFRPVLTGVHLLDACRQLAVESFEFQPPSMEGHPPYMDLLAGSSSLRELLLAGRPVDELVGEWEPVREAFEQAREPYLLYQ